MDLEFHQLDLRYEGLRVRRPERERRLLSSLAEGETALEQGWLLSELHERMGLTWEDLA